MNVVLPPSFPIERNPVRVELVECKSDTGKGVLSPQQIDRHAELCVMGYIVPVVSTKEEVDQFLQKRGFFHT